MRPRSVACGRMARCCQAGENSSLASHCKWPQGRSMPLAFKTHCRSYTNFIQAKHGSRGVTGQGSCGYRYRGLPWRRTWKLPLRLSYLMRLFLSRSTAAECARSRRRSSSRLSVSACSLGTPYSCAAGRRARDTAQRCALPKDACQRYHLGVCIELPQEVKVLMSNKGTACMSDDGPRVSKGDCRGSPRGRTACARTGRCSPARRPRPAGPGRTPARSLR